MNLSTLGRDTFAVTNFLLLDLFRDFLPLFPGRNPRGCPPERDSAPPREAVPFRRCRAGGSASERHSAGTGRLPPFSSIATNVKTPSVTLNRPSDSRGRWTQVSMPMVIEVLPIFWTPA